MCAICVSFLGFRTSKGKISGTLIGSLTCPSAKTLLRGGLWMVKWIYQAKIYLKYLNQWSPKRQKNINLLSQRNPKIYNSEFCVKLFLLHNRNVNDTYCH